MQAKGHSMYSLDFEEWPYPYAIMSPPFNKTLNLHFDKNKLGNQDQTMALGNQ